MEKLLAELKRLWLKITSRKFILAAIVIYALAKGAIPVDVINQVTVLAVSAIGAEFGLDMKRKPE